MANKLYDESSVQAIADAIRAKNGSSDTYTISEMATAVSSLPSGGGVRTCRVVVGTSTAGWTAADCDYLCDGTDDQVEIQEAIDASSNSDTKIVILEGTYNITQPIVITKLASYVIEGANKETTFFNLSSNGIGVRKSNTKLWVKGISFYDESDSNSFNGIYTQGTSASIAHLQVEKCSFSALNYAITASCWSCSIVNNWFDLDYYAVNIKKASSGAIVCKNMFDMCYYCIDVLGTSSDIAQAIICNNVANRVQTRFCSIGNANGAIVSDNSIGSFYLSDSDSLPTDSISIGSNCTYCIVCDNYLSSYGIDDQSGSTSNVFHDNVVLSS